VASPDAIATNIKNGALQRLGIVGAGNTASPEDSVLAGLVLDEMIDDAYERGDIGFVKEALDDTLVHGLKAMLAYDLAPYFSKPRTADLREDSQRARIEFRKRAASPSSGEPVKAEYF